MPGQHLPLRVRIASALAFVVVVAGCTPGGQFDPTELISTDIFDTKKKLQGDREPLFPNGVPGAQTGVPPDLVKGNPAPPEQPAADNNSAAATAAAPATPAAAPAKQKPKPKIARAAQPVNATQNQKPARPAPSIWPAPPQAAPAQQSSQSGQSIWPAPPQPASTQQSSQSGQSIWPAPPQPAPPQQTAQPAPSTWPNPPPPGTYSH